MAITTTMSLTLHTLADTRWVKSQEPTSAEIETSITQVKAAIDSYVGADYASVGSSAVGWVEQNPSTGLYSISLVLFDCKIGGATPTGEDVDTAVTTITGIITTCANVSFGGAVGSIVVNDDRAMAGTPE